ncbi:MAG: hypothetical protein EpisKO_41280 [Epibacterium sp.]
MSVRLSLEAPTNQDKAHKIKRNHIAATKARKAIIHTHRRLDEEALFEATANSIGILCAEFMLDSHEIMGPDLAKAMRDLLNQHIDRAIAAVETISQTDEEEG